MIIAYEDESASYRQEIELIESWIQEQQYNIKLYKISKKNSFLPLYQELVESNKKTLIISGITIDQI